MPGPFGRRLFLKVIGAASFDLQILSSVGAKATFGSILLDFFWARHVTGVQKVSKSEKNQKVSKSRKVSLRAFVFFYLS